MTFGIARYLSLQVVAVPMTSFGMLMNSPHSESQRINPQKRRCSREEFRIHAKSPRHSLKNDVSPQGRFCLPRLWSSPNWPFQQTFQHSRSQLTHYFRARPLPDTGRGLHPSSGTAVAGSPLAFNPRLPQVSSRSSGDLNLADWTHVSVTVVCCFDSHNLGVGVQFFQ